MKDPTGAHERDRNERSRGHARVGNLVVLLEVLELDDVQQIENRKKQRRAIGQVSRNQQVETASRKFFVNIRPVHVVAVLPEFCRQAFGKFVDRFGERTGGDGEVSDARRHHYFVVPLRFGRPRHDLEFCEQTAKVQTGEPDVIHAGRKFPTEKIDVRLDRSGAAERLLELRKQPSYLEGQSARCCPPFREPNFFPTVRLQR